MVKALFIATSNSGKLRELQHMCAEFFPEWPAGQARAPQNADETENSFIGNARIKARALESELKSEGLQSFIILADDSGLSVDLLDGAPGVHSARYSGAHGNGSQNVKTLLANLNPLSMELPKRSARYHCALVYIECDQNKGADERIEISVEGTCQGLIGFEAKGDFGFGYDPVFVDPLTQKTYAELSEEEKNLKSHRRSAFEKLKTALHKAQSLA